MPEMISGQAVLDALQRVSKAVTANSEYLTSLDQAMGDGDMGITFGKMAEALADYANTAPPPDLGKFLAGAGMAANKVAPSTMGTLTATALMRAGKVVMGKAELSPEDLAAMLEAAFTGMQERGKANLGDKTVLDAIHPASQALTAAVKAGKPLAEAGKLALEAAEKGREAVTPLRSKVGRASWVGERTEGQPDPGCTAFVVVMNSLVNG
jgi:dihydroxyacetone kinase